MQMLYIINTQMFRIQQSWTVWNCCIVYPRHPEYKCRKVIYDSCIRQTARFSGRHFGMKMWQLLIPCVRN